METNEHKNTITANFSKDFHEIDPTSKPVKIKEFHVIHLKILRFTKMWPGVFPPMACLDSKNLSDATSRSHLSTASIL